MVTVKELNNALEVIKKEFKAIYDSYLEKIEGDYLSMSNYKESVDSDICVSVLDTYDGCYKNGWVKNISKNGLIMVRDNINTEHLISIEYIPIQEWSCILNRMDDEFIKPKTGWNTRDITDWSEDQIELFEDIGIDYEEGVDLFDITEAKQYISRFIDISQYNLPSEICIDWNATYERYLNDFTKVKYKGTNYYIID